MSSNTNKGTAAAGAGRGSNVDNPPPNVEGVEKDVLSRDDRRTTVAGPSNVVGHVVYPSAAMPSVGEDPLASSSDPSARDMYRNVARRLADEDDDWTYDERPNTSRFVVTEVDQAANVGATEAEAADRERERVMAALVGEPGGHVVVDSDNVTHPWSPYYRSGFRVADMISVCGEKTTDMRMLSAVMSVNDSSYWVREAPSRYLAQFTNRVQIPVTLECDRVFLFEAIEAKYVDDMDAFLRGTRDPFPPILTFMDGMGLHKKPCSMDKTALSLSFVTGRVITYDDYSVVRSRTSDRDRITANVQLIVSKDVFPALPKVMLDSPWPLGLPMRLPPAIRFFGHTSQSFVDVRRERYDEAVSCEYVLFLMCALYQEIRDHRYVWLIDPRTLSLISDWRSRYAFPSIQFIGGRTGETVDFELVWTLISRLPTLGAAFRTSRLDYPTGQQVEYGELDVDDSFRVPRRGGSSNRERREREREMKVREREDRVADEAKPWPVPPTRGVQWNSVMLDSVVRSGSEMGDVFRNERERETGWTMKEVFGVVQSRFKTSLTEWRDDHSRLERENKRLRSERDQARADLERARIGANTVRGVAYSGRGRVSDPYADDPYGAPRKAYVPEQPLRDPYDVSRADPYAARPSTAAVSRSDEGSVSPAARDLDDPYAGPATKRARRYRSDY